ncbi:hypothetical protein EHQ27_18505 [Leptospira wolffii]|uniref:hypothetical protein n=1 Tax=Leptospira wolffii TaxID=409998 RepID=UPI001082C224|nr:hypothetical protein [Leptospira wolffii]TGK55260.1 hypothetical protein EHQ32_18730 [Leptospira wolffii]TGK65769.1 hypothetical protein EHQ27_18505 [Leptospira wolffii]TGK70439.1 hypothetical protein EHQ35_15780 [Leptospira wolffii]TGL30025.1 hypothetical protein EHQ57_09860 [Leptospira wolffii]
MNIKKTLLNETRWIFALILAPLLLWIVTSLTIHFSGLNSYNCEQGETKIWHQNSLKFLCESKEGNSESAQRETSAIISNEILERIHFGFLSAIFLFYPIALLVRSFVWVFKRREPTGN